MGNDTPVEHAASVYIPTDWRQAMARGEMLPEWTSGAALFADISGFTPLTEALTQALGLKRGAEELPRHLNRVYDALIAQVDHYGGSVVSFAGDAITCWFAEEAKGQASASLRATACALAMQDAMQQFATVEIPGQEPVALAVKVAVASGPARRFVVGDPVIQLMATLAGETLVRVAAAEHLANRGDVVVDAQTVAQLGQKVQIVEWRTDAESEETGERFGVVEGLVGDVTPTLWAPLTPKALSEEQVRPWVLPPVYERLQAGLGEFLTELRPAIALFLCFEGIDYDEDEAAGAKLDAYIRWVQGVLALYRGTLLQLTIGDKGSYLYAAWGAPAAHEDDARRAVAAALELRTPPEELDFIGGVQIGVSQGKMRMGAYGGTTRRTYGVLGDEVNLAARLMQRAAPGEALISQRVQGDTAEAFAWEMLSPIRVKGKAEPVPVARLVGERQIMAGEGGLLHAYTTSPLVGRDAELAQLRSILEHVLSGAGQIVRLEGATGAGKTHLAAEFAMEAVGQGVQVCVCACQSITLHIAYAPWRSVFRTLLALTDEPPTGEDATTITARQIAQVEASVKQLNPDWQVRLPLLGDLLDLPIPDNATTAAFDPRLRQEALFTLAVELVQTHARNRPLLLLVEDAHWMDEASLGLTLALGRVVAQSPVLLMLVQRPAVREDKPLLPNLNQLSCYHQLDLGELSSDSIGTLVANRLEVREDGISGLALSLIQAMAQGIPFFAEQLVDALRETENLVCLSSATTGEDGAWTLSDTLIGALREANCVVKDPASGEWSLHPDAQLSAVSMNIPDSVHGAVLSRLDRLPEQHKFTLKVSSVIGQLFELEILARAHPVRPSRDALQDQEETLEKREFVRLEVPPPRVTYTFKHNVTREVAYETLPTRQQQQLHRAVGAALEARQSEVGGQSEAVEQLAYHFSRGGPEARDKALFYLDKAARKAQREYANETALNYYNQALALEERWEWRQGQIQVLHILGRRQEEQAALRDLEAMPDAPTYEVAHLWGQYYEVVGDYAQAQVAVECALAASRERADRVSEANSLAQLGLIARRQGDYERAKDWYRQALTLFPDDATRSLDEARAFVQALNGLGTVHRQQGDFDEAQGCYERALALSQQSSNRIGEAEVLVNLGVVAYYQRNFAEVLNYHQRALEIQQAIGDRSGEGMSLYSFAQVNLETGDYVQAEHNFLAALSIQQAIGNRWEEVNIWNGLGILYQDLGDWRKAQTCLEEGLKLSQEIGDEAGQAYILVNLGPVMRDQGDLIGAEELLTQGLLIAQAQSDKRLISSFYSYLGTISLQVENLEQAIERAHKALAMRRELDMHLWTTADLTTLATAHLARGEKSKALDYAQQAMAILDECQGEGPECPQQDYFVCYQVLHANGKTKIAHQALQSAYRLVMARAEKIADPTLRQSFLENVPINRQIVQEVQKADT
jgi:tetratricopeptide (TPR) repeat protein/class 3 adenylate cyclase